MKKIDKWKEASRKYTETFNNNFSSFFNCDVNMLHMTEDGCYIFGDQKGSITKREKWEAMKKVIDSFYAAHNDQEIEDHNNSILRELGMLDEHELRSRPDTPKKTRKNHGFVYFVKADNGLVKIGRTKNLKQRLDHFTAKLPYKLELLQAIETDDTQSLEEYYHDKFSSKRKRGEWFELNESDLEEVMSLG